MQDARGANKGAHGGRQGDGVDADEHQRRPQADGAEEAVVLLEEGPAGEQGGGLRTRLQATSLR